jgi:hypothetical protein
VTAAVIPGLPPGPFRSWTVRAARQVRVDQARGAGGTHLAEVAALPDTVEHLGVTQRKGDLHMLARTDLRAIENRVDQPRPGAYR